MTKNNSINDKYSNRQLNIEVLRILLMIFVVLHHLLLSKMNLMTLKTGLDINNISQYIKAGFINSFIIISVNTFFLISGYFGIKFNIKKVIKLLLTVFTYVIIFTIIGALLNIIHIDINTIKHIVFCLESYWYLYVYLIILLISPILNLIVEHTSLKQAKYFTIITLLFFSFLMFIKPHVAFGVANGYSLVSGCYLYLIGSWIRKYNLFSKIKYNFISYILLSLLLFGLFLFFLLVIKNGPLAFKMFCYNNPLIIISAICFFKMFLNIKIKDNPKTKKIVLFFSKSVLSVYIIHGTFIHPFIAKQVEYIPFIDRSIRCIIIAIFIFIIYVLIDKLYKLIFEKLFIKITDLIYKVAKIIYNTGSIIVE